MIAIIAEKPSVGMEIARVVGANEKCNGYMQGHGYMVTWASGHLVELAPPESYGRRRCPKGSGGSEGRGGFGGSSGSGGTGACDLPLIPEPFRYIVRQGINKFGKSVADASASRQLGVIRRALAQCDSVIAATDDGCEGELIFRTIYNHLGCTLPVRRLWISSLTEESVEKGLREMREDKDYDRLHMAADCRAKADWLVSTNASAALDRVSGKPDSSLRLAETPTLAMIASRYLEHRGFLSSAYWSLSVTLGKDVAPRTCVGLRKFHHVGVLKDELVVEAIAARLKSCPKATVSNVEKKTIHEQPPLLYDLTTLQKECNIYHGMTAEQTLSAAQSLYEKKLITYPRTGSHHIPEDVSPQIPSLLRMILRMEPFSHLAGKVDPLRPTRRNVDDGKSTDHQAIMVTGDYVREALTANEQRVYEMICGRMLEAFSAKCEKVTALVEATICGELFRSRSVEIVSPGWRTVYNRPEEHGEEDDDIGAVGVTFTEGETLAVTGHALSRRRTLPKPLYTEASLLSAMEAAGTKEVDDKIREAVIYPGLGTPITRSAIIETLIRRDYVERSGKSLMPTQRGLELYKTVKDLRIADAELTAGWERSLAAVERGEMKPETFMKSIAIHTRQVTDEILSLDLKQPSGEIIPCPKCGNGRMIIHHRLAKCDDDGCGLVVPRRFLNKELTERHITQLLKSGKTPLIRGFKGKCNNTFDAYLVFDENFNLTFSFPGKSKKPVAQ